MITYQISLIYICKCKCKYKWQMLAFGNSFVKLREKFKLL